ncbi:RNA-directed DNA polymerase, eukaryota, reverse transcriptase zinc-binding domain protein, partial [Tanacetum coccineum]
DVTNEEIKEAIYSIEDNKASGPDGYSSKFFKAAWMVIGKDVCAAIKEFFTSGKLLGELNTTLISLVPKSKAPARVIDYLPISCCNIVYQGISKVITNRLKTVLNELVDVNQSAFISGRQISDNILLAQEFLKGYNWEYVTGCCAFKIDIMKAYDNVSWTFLEFYLKEFSFHPVMIHWIMVCLRTASFSICVNGDSHGFFKAKRGLRQGDPISPYLFTLVMEVLNLMIKRHIRRDNRFKYHTGCSKLKITSLCFADDLLMFCHGDLLSASILRRGLDEFSLASGLYPSRNKSEVFFSNFSPITKVEILMAMPFTEGTLPIRYLGVPLSSRRIKASDCRVLIDAVKNKINDWRNKSLSFAGRLQLISSILSSLQARGGNASGMVSIGWKEINKKGKEKDFNMGEVWKAIKPEFPKVIWYKNIWNDNESHSHLFFACAYSRRLWERLKPMGMMDNIGNDWATVIFGISNIPANNKIWSIIQRLTVRLRLKGLTLKKTADVIRASEIWGLPIDRSKYDMDMIRDLCKFCCYLFSFLGVFLTGFSLGKVFLRRQSCDADSVCGSLWMAAGNKFFAFWVELVDGDVSGEFGRSQASF